MPLITIMCVALGSTKWPILMIAGSGPPLTNHVPTGRCCWVRCSCCWRVRGRGRLDRTLLGKLLQAGVAVGRPDPRRKRVRSAHLPNHLNEAWPSRGGFLSRGRDALAA